MKREGAGIQCPRCGAENTDETRSACWSCFAQLSLTSDGEPSVVRPEQAPQEPGYIVPGLAEPPEGDENPPAGKPKTVAFDRKKTARARARQRVERPALIVEKDKPGSNSNFAAIAFFGALIVAAVAAWWFLLANPSPVPTARTYIDAMSTAISGDTKALTEVCTAESKAQIDRGFGKVAMQAPEGSSTSISIAKVNSVSVSGDNAQVSLDVAWSFSDMQLSMPMRIALVRQGSALRRQWKVDLPATNKLTAEEARNMMQKMFPASVPVVR